MPETDAVEEQTGFDMDSAVERLGNELFPEAEATDEKPTTEPIAEALVEQTTAEKPVVETTTAATPVATTTPETPVTSTAPKSWPKEMHEHWTKTPPAVQQYWQTREKQMLDGLEQYKQAATFGKTFHDVVSPYHEDFVRHGVEPQRAVQFLLEANRRLTTGTPESRQQAYQELGRNLGIQPQAPVTGETAPPPVDPRLQTIEHKLAQIEEMQLAKQREAYAAAQATIKQEVDAFASDPNNAFFYDVADDIAKFIKAGDSLQEAYQRAIWANPVTREKQMQARLQTEAEKAKERARLDALPKKTAKGVNVRSRDTARSSTDPVGSLDDTLKETLAKIKAR
jgi:hypothetical protein